MFFYSDLVLLILVMFVKDEKYVQVELFCEYTNRNQNKSDVSHTFLYKQSIIKFWIVQISRILHYISFNTFNKKPYPSGQPFLNTVSNFKGLTFFKILFLL